MRIAVCFDNLGPYHLARLVALSRHCQVVAVQTRAQSAEYAWHGTAAGAVDCETLVAQAGTSTRPNELRRRLYSVLKRLDPQVVAISGYSQPVSLWALEWCIEHAVPAICMSDSQRRDAPRIRYREMLKGRLVKLFSAGLVAGERHEQYLVELGMPRAATFRNYDVVDNDHFASHASLVRDHRDAWLRELGLPQRYFLCCARLIEKKNLPTLLRAFAHFRSEALITAVEPDLIAKLVILGTGDLHASLSRLANALGVSDSVIFAGFAQYDRLPAYYALADALVHTSRVDQWGLVVNEAMASGLPVVVSDACGCVPELVHDGENGFIVGADDAKQIADRMRMLSTNEHMRRSMGRASEAIISRHGVDHFARSMMSAAAAARAAPAKALSILDRIVLRVAAR